MLSKWPYAVGQDLALDGFVARSYRASQDRDFIASSFLQLQLIKTPKFHNFIGQHSRWDIDFYA